MRGNADFTIMKGFDIELKENDGHESDTLPPEATGDVTEQAEVEEVKKAEEGKQGENIKGSDNKPESASTSMSDDTAEVEDGAERPIDDSYVQDIQGEKVSDGGDVDKGWEKYNEKCATGVVVKDYGMTRTNVGDSMAAMKAGVDAEFTTKGKYWDMAKGAVSAAEKATRGSRRYLRRKAGEAIDKASPTRIVQRYGNRKMARSPLGSEEYAKGKAIAQGAEKAKPYVRAAGGAAALGGAGAVGYGMSGSKKKK